MLKNLVCQIFRDRFFCVVEKTWSMIMQSLYILGICLLVLLLGAGAYLLYRREKNHEGFVKGDEIVNRGWYVHSGPDTPTEATYHSCLEQNCGPEDLWCKQKCYYYAMKKDGPTDRCDLLCSHKDGEEKWLCYDHCYGNEHGVIVMFE